MITEQLDEKQLLEGTSVRMIKPKYLDQNTLKINPSFKLMKIKPIEVNLKPKVIAKLKQFAQSIKMTTESQEFKTFEEIDKIPENTETNDVTVKIASITRAMDGKYSKYKLAMIKDKDNAKNNLAVYPPHLDKMTPGKIYTISVVKKTNYKKETETYMRLSTVKRATIKEFDDKKKVFENVTTGEYVTDGTILGHGDIHQYNACTISWMKIRETEKCELHENNKEGCEAKTEFVTEIYVDAANEVETLHGFSRHFGLEGIAIDEKIIEETMEKLVSKEVSIEYNQDQDSEAKKRIVVLSLK